MAKAIHTMIRVFDLDRSREFYENALGLRVEDHFDFDGFSLTYMRNDESDFEIELTVNKGQSAPYTHGDGYGHGYGYGYGYGKKEKTNGRKDSPSREQGKTVPSAAGSLEEGVKADGRGG